MMSETANKEQAAPVKPAKAAFDWKWKSAIVAGNVMALAAILAMPKGLPPGMVDQLTTAFEQAQKVPAEAPAVPAARSDQLTGDELQVLAEAVDRSGISTDQKGSLFILFSDPNCPACQRLEKAIEESGSKFSPLIVPVAFKEGSMERAAGVICSAEPGKAWVKAIGGQKVDEACGLGRQVVEANNASFLALHFNSTPTLVSAAGKVAVGINDFESLMQWVKDNEPPVPAPGARK